MNNYNMIIISKIKNLLVIANSYDGFYIKYFVPFTIKGNKISTDRPELYDFYLFLGRGTYFNYFRNILMKYSI